MFCHQLHGPVSIITRNCPKSCSFYRLNTIPILPSGYAAPPVRALARHGKPEIFNSDQGCQFTSDAFTGVLKEHDIRISMDGKGRWLDNVFVERLWRSLKYEEVYLKACDSVAEATSGIGKWFGFFNRRRRHASLDRRTPDQVYS